MSIVEEATRRLEQLARAGVTVPWSAAGLENGDVQARVDGRPPGVAPAGPGATVHRITAEELAEAASARKQSRPAIGATRPAITVALDLRALQSSGTSFRASTGPRSRKSSAMSSVRS